jgi:hypothetical protein
LKAAAKSGQTDAPIYNKNHQISASAQALNRIRIFSSTPKACWFVRSYEVFAEVERAQSLLEFIQVYNKKHYIEF